MKMNWLATTAVVLMFGTGAAIAQQPDHGQKRDERATPRAQTQEQKTPSDRHAASDQTKGQTTGKAEERSGEPRRGEASSGADHRKQAEQQQEHQNREPVRKSEQQPRSGEHAGTSTAQDEHKGHGSTTGQASQESRTGQASEDHHGRDSQKNEHAQDTKGTGSKSGQTTGQARQPEGQKSEHAQEQKRSNDTAQQSQQKQDRGEQANRDSQSSAQQSQREHGSQQQGENTGQATDRTSRHAEINNDQRQKIVKQLRGESSTSNRNVNVHVDVGQRLPQRVDVHRLPPDIVSIAPQYRDYDYVVIDNRVAIVNPRSREVVDYIDEGPDHGSVASYGSDYIVLSSNVRDRFRELARSSSGTVGSTASSSGGDTCLSLRPVPEELVHENPELSKYRYLTIGDEAVLVDPHQHKIVQVID